MTGNPSISFFLNTSHCIKHITSPYETFISQLCETFFKQSPVKKVNHGLSSGHNAVWVWLLPGLVLGFISHVTNALNFALARPYCDLGAGYPLNKQLT